MIMLERTAMAESGLGGQFWFSATIHDVNCRNATYKEYLGTNQHEKLYGKQKNGHGSDLMDAGDAECRRTRRA